MTDTRDKLTALIVQHQRIPLFDDTFGQRCVGCDSLYGETDGPNWSRHAEHLADALLASDVLRDLLAEAEARGKCAECERPVKSETDAEEATDE